MAVIMTPEEICRARRIPNGFPEADFTRKVSEWAEDWAAITRLADRTVYFRPETEAEYNTGYHAVECVPGTFIESDRHREGEV
ncbi:MAG: hypothetical protein DELT_02577 [Desulfovibrio sp.]